MQTSININLDKCAHLSRTRTISCSSLNTFDNSPEEEINSSITGGKMHSRENITIIDEENTSSSFLLPLFKLFILLEEDIFELFRNDFGCYHSFVKFLRTPPLTKSFPSLQRQPISPSSLFSIFFFF
jgi:hypothetical protein